jgi:hypothetical protein
MAATDELHVDSAALDRYENESNGIAIRSLDDIKRVSLIFVKSGMFKGDRNLDSETKMYQAGVKIIAGVEFGIQPFAAMRGINIINGNAEMSANLMAAKVKKHSKYDYRVKKLDNEGCELTFFEYLPDGTKEELGPSSFTIEDARRAGLMNNPTWSKFPQNMCFARALSNGVRIHCPDVFYGAPVYTEGEISGEFESSTATADESAQPDRAVKAEPVEAEIVTDDDTPEMPEETPEEQAPADGTEDAADETTDEDSAQDGLDDAKRLLFTMMDEAGISSKVKQSSFVYSVLSKSKIESLDEAELVARAIELKTSGALRNKKEGEA